MVDMAAGSGDSWGQCLSDLIDRAACPFVVFRRPGEDEPSMWVGDECPWVEAAYSLPQGASVHPDGEFHFAPFDSRDNEYLVLTPSVCLSGWSAICQYLGCSPLVSPPILEPDILDKRRAAVCAGKDDYQIAFEHCLAALKDRMVDKVVLSRQISISCRAIDVAHYFVRACGQYPGAFVYIYCSPTVGCYSGATPELLLRTSQDNIYTVAVAGTMPAREGACLNQWNSKNISEHRVVADYIERTLAPFCSSVHKEPVSTLQIGALAHLYTEVNGILSSTTRHLPLPNAPLMDAEREPNPFDSLSSIARALHPTPAVCGLPQAEALALIRMVETQSRGYYSGYLGTMNSDGTELYVNIRCLHYRSGIVTLYAGGGLMPESDCQDEWQETSAKLLATASLL